MVRDGFVWRWVRASIAAGVVASIPHVAMRALSIEPAAPAVEVTFFVGAVLNGFAQWWVLRELLPSLSSRSWLAATAVGSALATVPALVGDQTSSASAGFVVLSLVSFVATLVLQAAVLRKHVINPRRWVVVNALGNALLSVLSTVLLLIVLALVASGMGVEAFRSAALGLDELSLPVYVAALVLGPMIVIVIPSALIAARAACRLVPRELPAPAVQAQTQPEA